jgi:hypothetical protein
VGTFSSGEAVVFSGSHFGSDVKLLLVRYGLAADLMSTPYGPSVKTCTGVTLDIAAQTIQCTTQAGSGSGYQFQVQALNALSNIGSDTYSYPTPPTVTKVTGCADSNVTNVTSNCPTAGGVTLTIFGTDFPTQSVSIKIGSNDCTGFVYLSSTRISCTLPAGAGLLQPVLVAAGVLFSQPARYVSYAIPVINTITGCSADPTNPKSIVK